MRAAGLLLVCACGRLGFEPAHAAAGDAADASSDARGRPNLVFVSSVSTDGAMGGLAGADAICQQRADAARLGGEFVALLWSSAGTPSSRLAGSRGWIDMTGRAIADQPTDFDNASTIYPILYDETGAVVDDVAWTGHSSPACGDWTQSPSNVFIPVAHTRDTLYWFIPLGGSCGSPSRLNCVERGRAVPVAPTPTTGRIAFVSSTLFTPGGGLAAADGVCNNDAAAAGLAGTYVAWLASSSGGPETRVAVGAPWRRVDGVALGATSDVLTTSDTNATLDTFISETATGAPWGGGPVWIGSNGMHCASWTSTTDSGAVGDPGSSSRAEVEFEITYPCNLAFQLICLQL